MANEVKTFNGVAIANIKNINGQTDSNIKELNGEEFLGITYNSRTFTSSGDFIVSSGGDVDIFLVGGGASGGSNTYVGFSRGG